MQKRTSSFNMSFDMFNINFTIRMEDHPQVHSQELQAGQEL